MCRFKVNTFTAKRYIARGILAIFATAMIAVIIYAGMLDPFVWTFLAGCIIFGIIFWLLWWALWYAFY